MMGSRGWGRGEGRAVSTSCTEVYPASIISVATRGGETAFAMSTENLLLTGAALRVLNALLAFQLPPPPTTKLRR